jgi:hypothetical protein
MSSLIISGDTSGAVTLAAPAVAGTTTLTLQANTGTLALQTDGIGFSQTWQNPTRAAGTTYYNTTGKPIVFTISGSVSAATSYLTITVNGVAASAPYWTGANIQYPVTSTAIIPPGASYSYNSGAGNLTASELR